MYIKQRKASTDPSLRSLLQKAVRRGFVQLVDSTARSLLALGDKTWLRSRAVVITFEEAWPLAQFLQITKDPETTIATMRHVARSTKQKDAAGLGALAFALHEGDQSMIDIVPSRRDLRIVAEALSRPRAFFDWARSECKQEAGMRLIDVAQQYLSAATWGWDKATILAGAFLAVSAEVPILLSTEGSAMEFPYWVALDKHTPEGKEALRRVGLAFSERYRHLIWAGFYFESAVVNALNTSLWFEAELKWRLRKAGLSPESAKELWERVRPALESELTAPATKLSERLHAGVNTHQGLFAIPAKPFDENP